MWKAIKILSLVGVCWGFGILCGYSWSYKNYEPIIHSAKTAIQMGMIPEHMRNGEMKRRLHAEKLNVLVLDTWRGNRLYNEIREDILANRPIRHEPVYYRLISGTGLKDIQE